jgi:predicted transcriptional regulator
MKLHRDETINFTLRMPVDTRLKLEHIAKNEDRTITNLINMALKRYIDMYEGQKK